MNLLVAIHGILTSQTNRDWVDEFDVFCARKFLRVEKREYPAGPFPLLNVYWLNPVIARGLVNEIEAYAEAFGPKLKLHFVAHSNGTDIALQTIKKLALRDIDVQTFIAVGSVLESDIRRSGLRDLLAGEHLQRAVAYASRADEAIKWGRWSIGYGDLGRRGWVVDGDEIPAVRAGADASRVAYRPAGGGELITRRFESYGHGDYFAPQNRAATFDLFLRDCGLGGEFRAKPHEGGEDRDARTFPLRAPSQPSPPSRELPTP